MKTTIDKAGRVVIPAALRIQAGLDPGTELEVLIENGDVRLRRRVPRPKLRRVGKRLVAVPTASKSQLPRMDVAALVEAERDRWPPL